MIINYTNCKNALLHLKSYGLYSTLQKTLEYFELYIKYNKWYQYHKPSQQALIQQQNHSFTFLPKISIVVPVYKTPELFLRQMISSVITQTYSNWELCIADGSGNHDTSHIPSIIAEYQTTYPNIKYKILHENRGISGNTNAALSLASGEYIALLDHDDILAPDALFEIVKTINSFDNPDVIYTDEDKVDISLKRHYGPYFKPDFNLDLLRSCNYITHFYVVKKELADQVGGFSSECDGSQDYDFILKTCELAKNIYHIPKILYHWRIHPSSVAGDPASKSYAYDSAVKALQNHLNRCGEKGVVAKDVQFGYYTINYGITDTPLVSIILRECSPKLKSQIQKITTYANYEFAASADEALGTYLISLFQVKEIVTQNWIENLLGNCIRNSIGMVGCKVYYNKNRVQEAGLVYTPDGRIHSPFFKYHEHDAGYCFRAQTQQNCNLIGPYCFIIKTDDYQKYFHNKPNTSFYAQVYDLCQTLRKNGSSIVMLPKTKIICSTKIKHYPRLRKYQNQTDSFYNSNFSPNQIYHLGQTKSKRS